MGKSHKKSILQYGGIVLGLVLIILMFRNTDLAGLMGQVKVIGGHFSWVLGVTFLAQSLAVLAWYLSFLTVPSLKTVFGLYAVRLVGESFSQVNPTSLVAGETLKMYLVKRLLNIRYMNAAMSIVLSRVMIALGTGFLVLLAVAILFQRFDISYLRYFSIAMCVAVVLIFLYIFHALNSGHGIFYFVAIAAKKLGGRFSLVNKVVNYFLEIDKDLVEFYKKKRVSFYSVFILSVLHQVVGAMEFYVIFKALGIDNISFLSCLVFDIASMLFRSAGFFIPGQLGLEELGNKIMFSIIPVPGNETWLTVSLVRRGRQLFWILMGFLLYIVISRLTHLTYKEIETVEN